MIGITRHVQCGMHTMHTRFSMHRVVVAAVVGCAASAALAGSAAVVEDFDTDAAGWQVADMPCGGSYLNPIASYSVVWQPSGGDAGAYIERIDPSSNCFYFRASSAFTGDLSAYAGGRLSYSLLTDVANYTLERGVILIGANNTVLYGPLPMPTTGDWSRRCVLLNASSFRVNTQTGPAATAAQLEAVLADVAFLYLPAEFGSTIIETVGIDRVELVGPCLADLDLSGVVDLGDLNLVLANFGSDVGEGDLNCDGVVDLTDLNAVLAAFGTGC